MKQSLLFITMSILCLPLACCCQSIIKVRGTQDSLTVKQQITVYLALLDIQEQIHLSVDFSTRMPHQLKGLTVCINAPEDNGYQIIRIKIDAHLSQMEKNLVLAHEMVHVKQYAKAELQVIGKRQVRWKGRKYGNQFMDFQRMPWESEAYQQDNQLVALYKKQLENLFEPDKPLTASKMHL